MPETPVFVTWSCKPLPARILLQALLDPRGGLLRSGEIQQIPPLPPGRECRKGFFAEAVRPSSSASLTHAYEYAISICMRTTLILDDALVTEAMRQTGVKEKTAVVRMGLEALIQREAARRLASLGGTMPKLAVAERRRDVKAPR